MKDMIGQEINIDDIVLRVRSGAWTSGDQYRVQSIGKKTIRLDPKGTRITPLYVPPGELVVITGNLAVLSGEWVAVSKKSYDDLVDSEFKLQCLEGAGIDNCEAYAFGMEEYHENGGGE